MEKPHFFGLILGSIRNHCVSFFLFFFISALIKMLQCTNSFSFHFENADDVISWRWGKIFTTKSVYNHLTLDETGLNFKHIWKSKIPYKIKIFLWLLKNNAILIKDNLLKRKWLGDPHCYFCHEVENIGHLFFRCPIAKTIWGIVEWKRIWCKPQLL